MAAAFKSIANSAAARASGWPFPILARGEQGIEVATGDGVIVIEALARAGDPTLAAESTLADVEIGDRLH